MYTATLLKLMVFAVMAAIAAYFVHNLYSYIMTVLATLPQF